MIYPSLSDLWSPLVESTFQDLPDGFDSVGEWFVPVLGNRSTLARNDLLLLLNFVRVARRRMPCDGFHHLSLSG